MPSCAGRAFHHGKNGGRTSLSTTTHRCPPQVRCCWGCNTQHLHRGALWDCPHWSASFCPQPQGPGPAPGKAGSMRLKKKMKCEWTLHSECDTLSQLRSFSFLTLSTIKITYPLIRSFAWCPFSHKNVSCSPWHLSQYPTYSNHYLLNAYNIQCLKLPKNCTHYFSPSSVSFIKEIILLVGTEKKSRLYSRHLFTALVAGKRQISQVIWFRI